MILNVSGRTDIIAFYSNWFMNRLEEGFIDVRNPFNPKLVSRIYFEDVDLILFCTKNPIPILDKINKINKPILFHVTVTPYNKDIEPYVPSKKEIIDAVKKLSNIIGKENVLYDGSLKSLKHKYGNNKYLTIVTKDKLSLKHKGIISSIKDVDGYHFVIDSNIINISDFLNIISNKVNIDDLEIINYINNGGYGKTFSIEMTNKVINYSGDFNKILGNSNIKAILDARAGWDEMFTHGGFGFVVLTYNGFAYNVVDTAGVKGNKVLYIPSSTEDTREVFIQAAKKRVKDYLGKDIEITYGGQIADIDEDNNWQCIPMEG